MVNISWGSGQASALLTDLSKLLIKYRGDRKERRALKLVYEDSCDFTFQEPLIKDKSVGVHQKILSHY